MSNKKTHLADFETCVFRVYLRNGLSYKKVNYIYLHPRLKTFQITKSADIFKNAFLPEESNLLEKIRHFEKFKKNFFMDLRFRDSNYIQTSFRIKNHHATSSSHARCVCRIFVNLIFISCHKINDEMKKIISSNKCPIERLHIDKKRYLICSLWLRQLIEI